MWQRGNNLVERIVSGVEGGLLVSGTLSKQAGGPVADSLGVMGL